MNKTAINGIRLPGASAALILAGVLVPLVQGMPASPHPFTVKQPDGSAVVLHVRGDEFFHWFEDTGGYTVVLDGDRYVYARLDAGGNLAATALLVGRDRPGLAGLVPGILPPPAVQGGIRASALPAPPRLHGSGSSSPRVPPLGTVKNVAILMRFSNHLGRTLPSNADFDIIFNASRGDPVLAPTGSVRDLYLENSYNALTLDSSVFGWVDLPQTEQYYANGTSGLGTATMKEAIADALNLADPLIDFGQFDDDGDGFVDAIAFIHSGYGAEWGGVDVDGHATGERIWSHRSTIPTWTSAEGVKVENYHISPGLWGLSGSEAGHIGVICHESGHFFGLPDLYDTSPPGEGIGSYCMMANSWGFTGDQLNPPHFSAWCKIALGWAAPTVISLPGEYAAPQVESNPTIYRIDDGYPSGEYLLIENRQPTGFESTMPQGGLAIWHIDEAKSSNRDEGYPGQPGWPENNNHYKVALLQADGQYQLERDINRGDSGDVYHADGVFAINATTVPNTDSYQNGVVYPTDISISAISASGPAMTFQLGPTGPAPEPGGPSCNADIDCTGNRWNGAACVVGTCYVPKNRYLSIDPTANLTKVAYRLTVTEASKKICSVSLFIQCEADGDCPDGETCEYKYDQSIIGTSWWLEEPVCLDNKGTQCPANSPGPHPDPCQVPEDIPISSCSALDGNGNEWMFGWYSSLGPKNGPPPAMRIWTETPLHIGDCIVAPVITYAIAASANGGSTFSAPVEIMTIRQPNRDWGDLTGGAVGDGPPTHWSPPNGNTDTTDSQGIIASFEQWATGYVPVCWADYTMDQKVDMSDVQQQVFAFEQAPGTATYSALPSQTAPFDCP